MIGAFEKTSSRFSFSDQKYFYKSFSVYSFLANGIILYFLTISIRLILSGNIVLGFKPISTLFVGLIVWSLVIMTLRLFYKEKHVNYIMRITVFQYFCACITFYLLLVFIDVRPALDLIRKINFLDKFAENLNVQFWIEVGVFLALIVISNFYLLLLHNKNNDLRVAVKARGNINQVIYTLYIFVIFVVSLPIEVIKVFFSKDGYKLVLSNSICLIFFATLASSQGSFSTVEDAGKLILCNFDIPTVNFKCEDIDTFDEQLSGDPKLN